MINVLLIFVFIIFLAVVVFIAGGFFDKVCRPTKMYIQIENLSDEFDVIIDGENFIIKNGIHDIDFETGFILLMLEDFFGKNLNFVPWKINWGDADKVIKIIDKYFKLNTEERAGLKIILAKEKFDFDKFIQKITFINKNRLKIKNFIIQKNKYTWFGLLLTNPRNLLNLNKEIFTINVE